MAKRVPPFWATSRGEVSMRDPTEFDINIFLLATPCNIERFSCKSGPIAVLQERKDDRSISSV